MRDIGRTIQEARKARGLTLVALAGVSGVHRSTLSRWERGEVTPFAYELTKVMDALGLSAAQRQECYRSLDAPRALQVATADPGAARVPISSGELLRVLRVRSGRTQADIARAVGVSQGLVARWEKGECWPDGQRLHHFCFACGATPEEATFLTTRSWRHIDPLPMDKAALDRVILYLENHDSSEHRSGPYLALSGRYQTLHRGGKIGDVEANAVYGCYGYYLSWRLNQHERARQIAAPALETVRGSRGLLTRGQKEAISAFVGAYLVENRVGDAYDLLHGVADRVMPRGGKGWWFSTLANVAERAGDIDLAVRYARQSLPMVASARDEVMRSDRLCGLLCRHGRYREALAALKPAVATETRPGIVADNLLNHARVFAGLGEWNDARAYHGLAERFARQHSLEGARTELDQIARAIPQ